MAFVEQLAPDFAEQRIAMQFVFAYLQTRRQCSTFPNIRFHDVLARRVLLVAVPRDGRGNPSLQQLVVVVVTVFSEGVVVVT